LYIELGLSCSIVEIYNTPSRQLSECVATKVFAPLIPAVLAPWLFTVESKTLLPDKQEQDLSFKRVTQD